MICIEENVMRDVLVSDNKVQVQDQRNLVEKIFQTDYRRVRNVSITYGKKGASVTEAQVTAYKRFAD